MAFAALFALSHQRLQQIYGRFPVTHYTMTNKKDGIKQVLQAHLAGRLLLQNTTNKYKKKMLFYGGKFRILSRW